MSHRYAAQAVKQFSCSYNTRPNSAALLSTCCDRNPAMERLTEAYPANTSQEAEQQLAQTASQLNRSPSAQTPPLPSQAAITQWQSVPQLISRFRPPHDHVGTLHDNWQASISTHPQVPALGWRETTADGQLGPYHWITYKQVGDLLTALGSGLLHLGLTPGSHIGLYGVNSKEWVLLDAAAHAYSMIPVPLYDTLGPHAVQYICQHAELAAVGCSAAAWPKVKACLPQCPTVRLVVIWGLCDSCSSPHTAQQQCHPSQGQHISASVQYVDHQHSSAIQQRIAAKSGHQVPNHCQVVTMNQLQAVGQHHLHPHVAPQPQDVATICYTSGTTGHPKGAVLTHANLIANAAGNVELQPPWQPGSRHLSYLPLAHIFERKNLIVAVHCGCSIGFYSGDARRLLEDAAALQPHMFMSVPRILNRLHDEALMAAQGVQQKLHHLSDQSTQQQQPASAAGDHDAAGHGLLGLMGDEQLYQSIRNKLGGQVQYMTTGASPISSHVLQFLRAAFACPVLEGYGMTETSCTISIQRQDDDSLGHVGQPLPCCEVMLKDVPDLGYFTSDQPYPRGEVCVRGPIIFQGYHKAPELTAQVIDNEGWFHTGDVGCWSTGGNLRLIDRVKNIFKLAQGEYVAPERLEAVYARSPFVQQCFVHGDSYKSQLVAVVVPDAEHLTAWAAQHQMQQGFEALCSQTVAEDAVLHSMVQQGRLEQLQGFELVAAVRLVPQPFTAEEGLVTPTMKLRRHAARDKFATLLQNTYESLERKLGRVDENGAAAGGDSDMQQAGAAAVPGGVGVARVHARCKL